MRVKTKDLIGPALDWAVAQCEMMREDYRDRGLLVHRIGYGQPMPPYSTKWSQGGPIIEREEIAVWLSKGYWKSQRRDTSNKQHGPTPLIAAMRCYCCSKLGDIVDVPEELK